MQVLVQPFPASRIVPTCVNKYGYSSPSITMRSTGKRNVSPFTTCQMILPSAARTSSVFSTGDPSV